MVHIRDGTRSPLQEAIKPFSTPILYADEGTEPGKLWVTGGTALFWRSPKGHFLVTAEHIIAEFVERLKSPYPKSVCIATGNGPLSLIGSDVQYHKDLDLAVLTVPGLETANLRGKKFYYTPQWPIEAAHEGETVGVIGFPGSMRIADQRKILTESIYLERPCYTSKSGETLLLGEFDQEIEVVKYVPAAKIIADLGGLSGAPVFAYRQGAPAWVGVIKRGREEHSLEGLYQASPAKWIRSDGTIGL